MRSILRAVVENAVVTEVSALAVRVDQFIIAAAEFLPYEEVEIVHAESDRRFRSYLEPAPEGSGVVAIPGARAGDRVSILSFVALHEGQTIAHTPRVVTVDAANRVVAVSER
jgi:aspartate 1-decarboxylase